MTTPPSSRGRYIVLEGDEGAGKTSQLPRLQHRLEQLGHTVKIVREPGGDPFGEELRRILKHSDYPIPPEAETLAFSAARASMLVNIVRPLLDANTWVISDRSYISTLIMQGLAQHLDSSNFRTVVEYGIQAAPPDLTLVLDIALDEASKRQSNRGLTADRFDRGPDFRAAVNAGYHDIQHANLVHVDGVGSPSEVENRLLEAIQAAGLISQ